MALAQPSPDEQYAAAFRAWGWDGTGAPERLADRLRDQPERVVQEVLTGLDGWMLERRRAKRPEAEWRRLLQLAGRLDRSDRRWQLRAFLVGDAPPPVRGVAGLVGPAPPWPALWELARGSHWRTLRELRGRTNPATEPALGVVLLARAFSAVGDHLGAEAVLRQAVTGRPDEVVLRDALGKMLERRGRSRLAEAIECYQAARARRPDLGVALAQALAKAGRAEEGEAVLRDLTRQQPSNPERHSYLGIALVGREKPADAAAAFREAIRLKPDFPEAHYYLGDALYGQGKVAEAVAACREAIRLKPDFPEAHYSLGLILKAQGKVAEAVAAYREAIRLKPDFPEAHFYLGDALRDQGRFGAALASLRKGHELESRRPDWRPSAGTAAFIRESERLVELDRDLPAFLTGKRKPSGPAEQLELASLCRHPAKRLYAASARFYAEAFAEQPGLSPDVRARHRYPAARAAALAGCGRGEDQPKPDDQERARLRRQALGWLRQDLSARAQALDKYPVTRAVVQRTLTYWQADADLAGVRDKGRLARLPEAERAAWRELWADVAALLKRAERK
jgi:tetratricopeptide (TPR) repeat protein